MGLGLHTSEEVIIDSDTGRLVTDGTWEYKIPAASCIPQQLNVTFLKAGHPSREKKGWGNPSVWGDVWSSGRSPTIVQLVMHAPRWCKTLRNSQVSMCSIT